MRDGIAIAGTLLVDKIYGIKAYPQMGELTQIKSIDLSIGGCVPNVSVDIKKLSCDLNVIAIGKVGNDSEAEYILDKLKSSGVDVSGIKKSEIQTSFTDVMSVIGGQRTFFTFAGASADFGFDDVDFNELNVKMLHLGYFLLLDKIDSGDGVKILKRANECGIKTSIDLVTENSDRYSLVIPALEFTDNLIINEAEAGMLTGIDPTNKNLKRIAKKLIELGVKERVIIHKPDLSVCLSKNGFTVMPSFELPEGFIKGTTGAGDAFCAGALLKIYQDATDEEILEFASIAAVTALSAPDATSGILSQEEAVKLSKFLKRSRLCL